MKRSLPHIIIAAFALLHMLANMFCEYIGIYDEVVLTVLTILMTMCICRAGRIRVDIASILLVGGPLGAYMVAYIWREYLPYLNIYPFLTEGPFTCLATSLLVGYSILLISRFLPATDKKPDMEDWSLIVTTSLIVIFARIALSSVFLKNNPREMISDNILYFLMNFCALTTVIMIFLLYFTWREKRKADKEQKEKHWAQFRYLKLNQQVNPHFLFNSLNVLDCLVSGGENSKASDYLHGLSGLYRYMLDIEESTLIRLESEIDFVKQYIELMKVRFPDGIEAEFDIPQEYMSREIVPCSIQLVVENAIKHNIASTDQPLKIRIYCQGDSLCVDNDIQPKAVVKSTRKGLNYIKQQYSYISEREVTVNNDGKQFRVSLPLI